MDPKIVRGIAEIARIASLHTSPDSLRAYMAFREIRDLIKLHVYTIEDGCVENLDFEPHARGKNWIATDVARSLQYGSA